jgi:hypothetical protein
VTNDKNILQLIYISTATQKLTPEDLKKILEDARPANQAKNITGMLLYRDGLFIQVLEGEPNMIETLYANIKKDTRHRNVHIVSEENIAEREFSEWTMGFRNVSDDIDGANHFLETDVHDFDCSTYSSVAKKLLARFRDMK